MYRDGRVQPNRELYDSNADTVVGSGKPRVGKYARTQGAQNRIYGTHTHAVPPATNKKQKNTLYNTYQVSGTSSMTLIGGTSIGLPSVVSHHMLSNVGFSLSNYVG